MKIGIYLGTQSDDTRNIESALGSWGEMLDGEFNVEVFGDTAPRSTWPFKFRRIQTDPPLANKFTQAYTECCKYIDSESPDLVVQFWKYSVHSPAVTLAGYRKNTPTVVRNTGSLFQTHKYEKSLARKIFTFSLNNLYAGRLVPRLASKVIALGPSAETALVSRGASADKIEILPPSVPEKREFTTNNQENYRSELNLPSGTKIALYVGRLTDRKGMEFLSTVIRKTANDVVFVLVGDGPYSSKLRNRFDEATVRLPGKIPHEDVHKYYKSSDVYLHPSPFEGMPLVILEALSCGLPVIARPAGEINYAVSNIVESPAEMATMLRDETWETTWKNREKFAPEYQQETLRRIFRDAIAER